MSRDTQKVKRYTTGPLPLSKAKHQNDRCESLLAAHQRAGGSDMTNIEVCEAYQRVYGEVLYPHHGMRSLGNLEAANRVICDRENKRRCSITGSLVQTYTVPMMQVRLCA